jgi:hypothetical protein
MVLEAIGIGWRAKKYGARLRFVASGNSKQSLMVGNHNKTKNNGKRKSKQR